MFVIQVNNFPLPCIATAFASASTFFRNLATTGAGNDDDVTYADTLLVHATQLFNASHNILPYTKYQASVPEIFTVYGSTGNTPLLTWAICQLSHQY